MSLAISHPFEYTFRSQYEKSVTLRTQYLKQ